MKFFAFVMGIVCIATLSGSTYAATYYTSQYPGYVLKCDNYSCYYARDTGAYSFPTNYYNTYPNYYYGYPGYYYTNPTFGFGYMGR